MNKCWVAVLAGVFTALLSLPSFALADEALWSLLKKGGHVVMMRHAITTPGVGDPPVFD